MHSPAMFSFFCHIQPFFQGPLISTYTKVLLLEEDDFYHKVLLHMKDIGT